MKTCFDHNKLIEDLFIIIIKSKIDIQFNKETDY